MKFSGRALVVEDYHVNQILLKTQLEKLGFQVDLADNGKVAVRP
jgi:CheY-like chemotaxis protein